MRILLLGGSGGLGRDLQPVLAERHEVAAPPHGEVDLLVPDALRRALDRARADAVVNAAAFADVDGCERDPDRAHAVNADGVRHLATACRERNVLLAQISTDYVFDGRKEGPYVESDATRPLQVYGRSKLAGERNALQVAPKAMVVRSSWLFTRHGRNFANAVLAAARDGGEVRAVRDWFGTPTFTLDLARALRALLEAGATGVFHVANPGPVSRFDQAREILEAVGRHRATLVPVAAGSLSLVAARPRSTALASERLESIGLRLRPRADAVRDFVAL